jgi:predicted pyridoxine 5'-phosphate oxidase superfamily flavin-nucleotide-binding protein
MTVDPEVRTEAETAVLCWLATVYPTGTPNVTPKEIFAFYGDEHLVIADIASSNSVRNIRNHRPVCVSFVNIFQQRGFKLVGIATIVGREDEDFPILGAKLLRMAGSSFPIRHVISVRIDQTSRIWDQVTDCYRTRRKASGCGKPTMPMALSMLNDVDGGWKLAGATRPADDRRSRDEKRFGDVRVTVSITPKQ